MYYIVELPFQSLILTLLCGFSQPLKRKGRAASCEAESSEWSASPGYTDMVNSPLQTPVSVKGGKAYGRPKATKNNRSGPPTPVSNAGEKCSVFQDIMFYFCA